MKTSKTSMFQPPSQSELPHQKIDEYDQDGAWSTEQFDFINYRPKS